jgi:hypothetical protein
MGVVQKAKEVMTQGGDARAFHLQEEAMQSQVEAAEMVEVEAYNDRGSLCVYRNKIHILTIQCHQFVHTYTVFEYHGT